MFCVYYILIPLIVFLLTFVMLKVKYSGAFFNIVGSLSLIFLLFSSQFKLSTISIIEFLPNASLAFATSNFSFIFATLVAFLWFVTVIYSMGYLRTLDDKKENKFFMFFAISIFSALGVAFSSNLFTMYLFYELLTISTFPLVSHYQDSQAVSSGRKYVLFILGSSICLLLPALILLYSFTGTLEFDQAQLVANNVPRQMFLIIVLMFLFGFAKSALMPFHFWLPGAMVAPTPVSALLHAVAVVKVGVFCLYKVFYHTLGFENFYHLPYFKNVLIIISSVTVILSSIIAINQDGLKKRLAYSTISQLGYIILGIVLFSQTALLGASLHIVSHAFSKITLFFCAGAIYVVTHKKYISELKGLGYKMPITFSCFLIGSLGIIGFPFTGGFISKWQLLKGSLEAGQPLVFCIFLLGSFIAALYLLPVIFTAYQKNPNFEEASISEAPIYCLIPIIITASMSIMIFFCNDFLIEVLRVK